MTDTTQMAGPPGGARASLGGFIPQRSTGLKLLLVCGLALLMAIPALFVYGVVYERSQGAQQALNEVAAKVGGEQTVLGPVLAIPYSYAPDADKPGEVVYGTGLVYPDTGAIQSDVKVEERQRGIHLVPVYTADADFTAVFDPAKFSAAWPRGATPIWTDARFYMGIRDARGLKTAIRATANSAPLSFEPAAYGGGSDSYSPVPASDLSLAAAEIVGIEDMSSPLTIRAAMSFSGAGRLAFAPFARDTDVEMTSDWGSPSFTGGVLPSEHNVGEAEDSFTANWRVPYLARGIPGAGPRLNLYDVTGYDRHDLAVRFIREANPYQSVQRALKYGAMFIGLVFLTYFLFEVTSHLRAHPAQYILVGLAQTIFYLLLLALSEKTSFDVAFLIAAGMTVGLISAYAKAVFQSWAYGGRALLVLSGIYGLIYMLMRAEDNALIAGAFASFAAIAFTMWMTRNVDWYGERQPASA
ncbi:MAG: cell envelope integrity protein CreD [Pseudomonadota bacterium]